MHGRAVIGCGKCMAARHAHIVKRMHARLEVARLAVHDNTSQDGERHTQQQQQQQQQHTCFHRSRAGLVETRAPRTTTGSPIATSASKSSRTSGAHRITSTRLATAIMPVQDLSLSVRAVVVVVVGGGGGGVVVVTSTVAVRERSSCDTSVAASATATTSTKRQLLIHDR